MCQDAFETAFLDAACRRLRRSTAKIEHCIDQLNDAQVWWRPTRGQNSVGILVVHLCGNVRQWIVAGVGGARDVRDRLSEFCDDTRMPKRQLLATLNECRDDACAALVSAKATSLLLRCRIQGFDTTRLTAIFDTVAHFQGHTQEIICLTRQQLADEYAFHWVPSTPEETSSRPK